MYIYRFIRSWFRNRKYVKIIKEAIARERLVEKLSIVMGTQFEITDSCVIWAVINPYIKDGKYSPEQVLEINAMGGTDDTQWVEQWTMNRISLIRQFINTQNLFEVLTYSMDPLRESNYLLMIKPVTYEEYMKNLGYMIWELCGIWTAALITGVCHYFL